ncbi:MAG: (2Fe-2S)-binding protein [Polyangiales bacterium]
MIVCVCQGVRCSEVRSAIRGGALTVEAVGVACGAGTDCGSCHGCIEDLVEEVTVGDAIVSHDASGRAHLAVSRPAA